MGAGRLWAVVGGLLAAVLVPTAVVLWFMTAAMRNERLAVRQRLAELYQARLTDHQQRLAEALSAKADAAGALLDGPAPQAFARATDERLAQAVVICHADGSLAYPAWTYAADRAGGDDLQLLQLERTDPARAQLRYSQIAAGALNDPKRVQALIGQARCLLAQGQTGEACALLENVFHRFEDARDAQGRLMGPLAGLRAWEADPHRSGLATALLGRACDYSPPDMPPSQRRMLLSALLQPADASSQPHDADAPASLEAKARGILEAEALAEAYLSKPRPVPSGTLSRCGDDLWHVAWCGGEIIGVFSQADLAASLSQSLGLATSPSDASAGVRLAAPGQGDPQAVTAMPAGAMLPGWTLEWLATGPEALELAAQRQQAGYLWLGVLAVGAIAVAGITVSAVIARQLRLAQLKNSLVAAVTHELKTPLSSVRVLTDLLLSGQCHEPHQVREYHQLIARENQRLGRLIDNFLTYSRIERNKPVVNLRPVDLGPVIAAAVEAVADRFEPPHRLRVDAPSPLPRVLGDADALTTVLINLLDNACKYTGPHKEVSLRVSPQGRTVRLAVTDNGVGIHRRDRRRIFRRFYRVDRHLSAPASGCGLGLSIVKFIVEAHGSRIDVESALGAGSTFGFSLAQVGGDGAAQGTGDGR